MQSSRPLTVKNFIHFALPCLLYHLSLQLSPRGNEKPQHRIPHRTVTLQLKLLEVRGVSIKNSGETRTWEFLAEFPTLAAHQSHPESFLKNSDARDPPLEILTGLVWDPGTRIFSIPPNDYTVQPVFRVTAFMLLRLEMGIKVNEEV